MHAIDQFDEDTCERYDMSAHRYKRTECAARWPEVAVPAAARAETKAAPATADAGAPARCAEGGLECIEGRSG